MQKYFSYLYPELVYKISIHFCRNPNEIIITPGRLFTITNFIIKNIPEKYKSNDARIKLCRNTLNQLIKYFPENVYEFEQVNYFIDFLLEDYILAKIYD